jgi:hypothetical protein
VRTLKYLRALRRLGDPDHTKLARLDPEIFAARQLHLDARLRFEIEVRVLANQDAAEIAECCGVAMGVIIAYEHVFCDMRRMLDADDYILNKTQLSIIYRPEIPDLEATIRAAAYAIGRFVVDSALRVYDEMRYPSRLLGKTDPHPSFTDKVRHFVRWFAWIRDPRNERKGFSLWLLSMRTEQAGAEIDCGVLLRPLLATVSFAVPPNPEVCAQAGPQTEGSHHCAGHTGTTEAQESDVVQPAYRIASTA